MQTPRSLFAVLSYQQIEHHAGIVDYGVVLRMREKDALDSFHGALATEMGENVGIVTAKDPEGTQDTAHEIRALQQCLAVTA